jgi:hypothetical protein
MGENIPAIALKPLEVIFNKPHPYLLLRPQDSNTWVISLLQEVKRDIIFYSPMTTRRTTTGIQAHLLSGVKKFKAFLEYQAVLPFQDALSFLGVSPTHCCMIEINGTKCCNSLIFLSSTSFIHTAHSSLSHLISRHLIHGVAIRCIKKNKK